MSSLTKVLLFQSKSLLIGSLHLPTHGKQMGNYESVCTQKISIQLLDMITTKLLLWEEITHELVGSTCFTKLNESSSYLCIVLNHESSLLMTFNTPWGRFRYVCLPWGLVSAQDIFQWMMDHILTHCDGVIGTTDNAVVHGKDDKEHDKCLQKLMRVTSKHGLVFNKDKYAVKQISIVFFGCVCDASGANPDPEKVSAVHKMLAPEAANQLQKFLGLVTYLSPFLHCTPMWAAEERNRIHLEQLLSGSI